MTPNDQPGVVLADGLLLALLSLPDTRARGMQAWLKWRGPGPLPIGRSHLSAPDRDAGLHDAFGLAAGTRIDAPASLALAELRKSGEPGDWALNEIRVTAPPFEPERPLTVLWLPLLVPVPDDPHFIVAIRNPGQIRLSLPDMVFESRLRIDGVDHAFAEPGLWDGRAFVAPGDTAVLRLRLDHYGAAVPNGPTRMAFACSAWSSDPVSIVWLGKDA